MNVNGEWFENITCKKCRNRHPAELSCKESKIIADEMKLEREQYKTITEQATEMSDTEILEIYFDDPDILTFARNLLRKAQEK